MADFHCVVYKVQWGFRYPELQFTDDFILEQIFFKFILSHLSGILRSESGQSFLTQNTTNFTSFNWTVKFDDRPFYTIKR